ncbi:MAG: GNAT family N-acetyltransferase [Steroidobacter sp.]
MTPISEVSSLAHRPFESIPAAGSKSPSGTNDTAMATAITANRLDFRAERATTTTTAMPVSQPDTTAAATTRPMSYCIFQEPWWLDAVAPGAWRDITVTSGGVVRARWPIYQERRGLFDVITLPPLTHRLGPWLDLGDATKSSRRYELEKDLTVALLEQLPPYDILQVNCHSGITNVLPFVWAGFEESARYTYVIDLTRSETELWDALRENIRRESRKARKQLRVETIDDVAECIRLIGKTYARQGNPNPFDSPAMHRLNAACAERGRREMLVARDERGAIHAAIYLVWDATTTYYLAGGADPELRTSGAHSLLMWEALVRSRARSTEFDMTGSMVESIERFFRAFGGQQRIYFSLNKMSRRARFAWHGKKMLQALFGR